MQKQSIHATERPGAAGTSANTRIEHAQTQQKNQQKAKELIKKAAGTNDTKERGRLIREALDYETRAQLRDQYLNHSLPDSLSLSDNRETSVDFAMASRGLPEDAHENESFGSRKSLELDIGSEQSPGPESTMEKKLEIDQAAIEASTKPTAQHDLAGNDTRTDNKIHEQCNSDAESLAATGEIEVVDTLEVTISSTGSTAGEKPRRKPRKLEIKGKKKPRKIEVRSHG